MDTSIRVPAWAFVVGCVAIVLLAGGIFAVGRASKQTATDRYHESKERESEIIKDRQGDPSRDFSAGFEAEGRRLMKEQKEREEKETPEQRRLRREEDGRYDGVGGSSGIGK